MDNVGGFWLSQSVLILALRRIISSSVNAGGYLIGIFGNLSLCKVLKADPFDIPNKRPIVEYPLCELSSAILGPDVGGTNLWCCDQALTTPNLGPRA